MPDRRPFGIKACKSLCGLHTGQIGRTNADRGIAFPVEVFSDLNGLETCPFFNVAGNPVALVGGQFQNLRQCVERCGHILDPVGNDIDAEHSSIERERLPLMVDNPPAPWRDQRQVDAVAFGLKRVAFILEYRQIRHARGEQRANGKLCAAKDKTAAAECELCLRFANALLVK